MTAFSRPPLFVGRQRRSCLHGCRPGRRTRTSRFGACERSISRTKVDLSACDYVGVRATRMAGVDQPQQGLLKATAGVWSAIGTGRHLKTGSYDLELLKGQVRVLTDKMFLAASRVPARLRHNTTITMLPRVAAAARSLPLLRLEAHGDRGSKTTESDNRLHRGISALRQYLHPGTRPTSWARYQGGRLTPLPAPSARSPAWSQPQRMILGATDQALHCHGRWWSWIPAAALARSDLYHADAKATLDRFEAWSFQHSTRQESSTTTPAAAAPG